MDPQMTDHTGLWRRTLLIGADGGRDGGGDVRWLQGLTAYVDSRGFAGSLHRHDDVFEWHRDVDLEPPGPFPDAGSMNWDGDVLVETGVHEDYVEHWVRDHGPGDGCGAAFLRDEDGAKGLLLYVGQSFGWAGAGVVVIGRRGDPDWTTLEITLSDNHIRASGRSWLVERSEGDLLS